MNKKKLLEDFKVKRYRDAFVSTLIDTGIPFQIKTLREQRNEMSQKELGELAGMKQEAISRLENPDYGKLNLNTLKRIASAFDVGLIVRFAPLSELVKWELNLTSESLKAVSYDEDLYFKEEPAQEGGAFALSTGQDTIVDDIFLGTIMPSDTNKPISLSIHVPDTNEISLDEYRQEKTERERTKRMANILNPGQEENATPQLMGSMQ